MLAILAYVEVGVKKTLGDPVEYVDLGSSWNGHIEGLTEGEQSRLSGQRMYLKLPDGVQDGCTYSPTAPCAATGRSRSTIGEKTRRSECPLARYGATWGGRPESSGDASRPISR